MGMGAAIKNDKAQSVSSFLLPFHQAFSGKEVCHDFVVNMMEVDFEDSRDSVFES